jgi:hypothetical protein
VRTAAPEAIADAVCCFTVAGVFAALRESGPEAVMQVLTKCELVINLKTAKALGLAHNLKSHRQLQLE